MRIEAWKFLVLILCVVFSGTNISRAQDDTMVAQWSFDRVEEGKVQDIISGEKDTIEGKFRLLKGVKGQAIVMDGYTTCIVKQTDNVPKFGPDFTLEAWIALGAYPWNWAPIVAQENTISMNSNQDMVCWPDDIVVNSPKAGFFFGISPEGYLGLHIGAQGWNVCRTEKKIPLHTWTHVAATFHQDEGVVLYVDGQKAGGMKIDGRFRQAEDEDLRMGMSHQMLEPTHPVRAFATLACWYSLDGILDEVLIHNNALKEETIAENYKASTPEDKPDLPARIMPSGPPGPGVFGASYMRLQYYPEWDALWPVSSDPDVVVQFDDSPVRVVFWRGTRYGPAWVMKNNMWMADQSIENFNNRDGCIEHMLDPRCRFSHVRIIENTPARVVVHWRYCPTSANKNHSQVNPISGWEDWVDEYYTFYPDQVGIRKVVLHSEGRSLWPEEVIALCQPGQTPEDVVELSAMTLVNLKGKSHTYTWADTTPKVREGDKYLHFGTEPEERPVIMRVNMKSECKPFQIFETSNRFSIFAHEHRKGFSHFPWWNHWPVSQVPSDGRYCQAADRASHFSLAWGGPPAHKGKGKTYWWAWMYGATKDEAVSLVPLGRSWLLPPKLIVENGSEEALYDLTQRCYVILGFENGIEKKLQFILEGNPDSPIINPAFIVENWGNRDAEIYVNGKRVPRGKFFRYGHIRRVNRYDLVVWLHRETDQTVEISLSPVDGD
ncbi:MAG: LamG domain-containing protein [Candidatus Aminicenantes bacterium]|nr:MAG: LamG domain-containing protein [Candidatus Aminicenantes bacterium]